MAAVTICSDFGAPQNKSDTSAFQIVSISKSLNYLLITCLFKQILKNMSI